jgi:hypothetical protein
MNSPTEACTPPRPGTAVLITSDGVFLTEGYDAAMMTRLTGAFAVLALLASPTVAQARYFCRYTGMEITDCEQQRVPAQPFVTQEGCCDRRVSPVAAPATRPPGPVLLQVWAVALSWTQQLPLQPLAPSQRDRLRPDDGGPPLFLQQRALLI